MKRLTLEFGLAALIFSAANGVYGIDALVSQGVDGKHIAGLFGDSPANMRINLAEQSGSRVPTPVVIEVAGDGTYERSFCVSSGPGTQQVWLDVDQSVTALMSDSTAIPYSIDIVPVPGTEGASGPECGSEQQVTVRLSIIAAADRPQEHVLTDTVIMSVGPE